jgi:hypothetical protein
VQVFVQGRLLHSIPLNVQAQGEDAYGSFRPN